jgi:hypothetical protein
VCINVVVLDVHECGSTKCAQMWWYYVCINVVVLSVHKCGGTKCA